MRPNYKKTNKIKGGKKMKHRFYAKQEDHSVERYTLTNQDFAFFICAVLIGVVIGGLGTLAYLSANNF